MTERWYINLSNGQTEKTGITKTIKSTILSTGLKQIEEPALKLES